MIHCSPSACSLGKMFKTGFGRQRIQAHVPGVREHGSGALTIKAETHQARPPPLPPRASESQCSIVETTAHAQAATLAVDAHEGNDDEIEPTRRGRLPLAVRHGNAEHAPTGFARQRIETQTAMTQ